MSIQILTDNISKKDSYPQKQNKNIRFVRYGDLVMLNESSLKKLQIFNLDELDNEEKIQELKSRFKCERIAIHSTISDDDFRTPKVRILGSSAQDPWVFHVDNGIKYTFNVTKNMFSKGNIKEKLRLSSMDCRNEIVVDLFAGIGYFSLVFAIHCKASKVYCCEWNPDAVEALKRNAILNKVQDRIIICEGDNRMSAPVNVANHVNMGLIPTSRESLETGCRSLNPSANNLVLHVHDNVNRFDDSDDKAIKKTAEDMCLNVQTIMSKLHPEQSWFTSVDEIVRIKPYAPHIDHMVFDIRVLGQ